jgi:hypothetical protein
MPRPSPTPSTGPACARRRPHVPAQFMFWGFIKHKLKPQIPETLVNIEPQKPSSTLTRARAGALTSLRNVAARIFQAVYIGNVALPITRPLAYPGARGSLSQVGQRSRSDAFALPPPFSFSRPRPTQPNPTTPPTARGSAAQVGQPAGPGRPRSPSLPSPHVPNRPNRSQPIPTDADRARPPDQPPRRSATWHSARAAARATAAASASHATCELLPPPRGG